MGHCGSRQRPIAGKNNPDDPIGHRLGIRHGCTPKGSERGMLESHIPQNGEYSWAGAGGDCFYCSLSAPEQLYCSSGCNGADCCAIHGASGSYARTSYRADPVQCCLKSASTIGGLTCHPKYRNPTSVGCYNAVKKYCLTGNRLFEKDICAGWCSSNPTECKRYKRQICDNINSFRNGHCTSWCLRNQGNCDQSVTQFCKEVKASGKTHPICNCLHSHMSKYRYNPLCQDRTCINSGYATSSMIASRGNGCTIVDCSVYFDIKQTQGDVSFEDVEIKQRCGNTPPKDIQPPVKDDNSDKDTQDIQEEIPVQTAQNKPSLYIILSLVIMIILVIAGIMIFM